MPLNDLNNMPTVVIDKDWLTKSGWVERTNKQPNMGLGNELGTRALSELADDSYTLLLDISWLQRERLQSALSVKFELPADTLNSAIADAAKSGGDEPDLTAIKDKIALAVDEQSKALKYMALMKTYLNAWSHVDDKGRKIPITEGNIERIPAGIQRVLLYIIDEIHKGQFLAETDPLSDT